MKKYLWIIAIVALLLPACGGNKKETVASDKDSIEVVDQSSATESSLPTVIDFSATWCGPCQQIAPLIHKLAEEYEGKVNFQFIDVDENRAIAEEYKIESIPTFIFLDKEGKEIERVVGADEESVKKALEQLAAN